MKFTSRLFHIVLVGMIILAGCETTSDEREAADVVEYPVREDFTEAEKRFINAYNEGVQRADIPDTPGEGVIINQEPDSELPDFAIINLEKETYGTDVFVFLPLENRDLTEDEIRSLASAFHQESPEIILQDRYSYKLGSRETRAVDSNRPLTVTENFMERISVLEQYLTKGKRAKGNAADYPLQFIAADSTVVRIYPDASMTEEQILYLLNQKYGDMPKEAYTPKDGQLGESKARKKAKNLLKEFVTDESPTRIYLIYTAGTIGGRQVSDYWMAYVHLEEDDNDYCLRILADSGELLEWKRLPHDFYTDKGYSGENMQNAVTEEQLLQVAADYVQGRLYANKTDYVIDNSYDDYARVTVGTDRGGFIIYIDKDSLVISRVEIQH